MEKSESANGSDSQLTTILLAHEKARARAWLGKNRQALEVLLDKDFVEINMLGRLSRADVLGRLFSILTLHEFEIEQPHLHPAGAGSAILSYRCLKDMTVNGQRITGTFHVAAHYVRRNNKWFLLLWQITPQTGS